MILAVRVSHASRHRPSVKGSRIAARFDNQCAEKMSGKGKTADLPALRTRGMNVKNAKDDRQSRRRSIAGQVRRFASRRNLRPRRGIRIFQDDIVKRCDPRQRGNHGIRSGRCRDIADEVCWGDRGKVVKGRHSRQGSA